MQITEKVTLKIEGSLAFVVINNPPVNALG
ncbi:MAG: hypothetical protein ACI861_000531, partial [Paracoccaceae bacterium]